MNEVKVLVELARQLPGEVERLIVEVANKKRALHELLAMRQEREAGIAGEVAGEVTEDGKKRFPNEEARKAEIARRLAGDEWWQDSEQYLNKMRAEMVELEARLDRARYEHRTAVTLLNLLAGAVQAGRKDLEEAVLGKQEQEQARQEQAMENFVKGLKGEIPQEQEKQNGNGLKEAKVKVLETRTGRSKDTIRAWCETEDGEKKAVYGKGDTGEKLVASVGKEVIVRYREGDYGWFAVSVK